MYLDLAEFSPFGFVGWKGSDFANLWLLSWSRHGEVSKELGGAGGGPMERFHVFVILFGERCMRSTCGDVTAGSGKVWRAGPDYIHLTNVIFSSPYMYSHSQ